MKLNGWNGMGCTGGTGAIAWIRTEWMERVGWMDPVGMEWMEG